MALILVDILTSVGRHWRNCSDQMEQTLEIDIGLPDHGPPLPWRMINLGPEWDHASDEIKQRVLRTTLDEKQCKALDEYVDHPIHRISERLNKLSDIQLNNLKMFAWRAHLPDGLHLQPNFPTDLTGLVSKFKALDRDGTTAIIIEEFAQDLVNMGIAQFPEQRRIGF